MNSDKALWKSSKVFAPDFPRQSSDGQYYQGIRYNRSDLCMALEETMDNEMPGYYSVYSFPRGHSKDNNIPKVDCVFIDLDILAEDYDPEENKTSFDAWRRELSDLLVRSRMVANAILESEQEAHYRATLSGHKGIHLYLDFPTIAPSNGKFEQFKNGLKAYGEKVMSGLDSMAGGINIDPWVDVDASDLSRLSRHPNTINFGSAYDDETRWCVPITIEELSELHVDDYLRLTKEPRWVDGYARNPSESVGDIVSQEIRSASVATNQNHGETAKYDLAKIKGYEGETDDQTSRYEDSEHYSENPAITADDIGFLTSQYPCIAAYFERDDAFDYGNDSHIMEVNVIAKLAQKGVPRDVMHELFSKLPGYSKRETDEQINTVLGREYKSFNCETIADRCPQFCLGDDCGVYQRNDDIQR